MKYGAMNFPVKPLSDEMARVSRLGFDYIEIAMDPPAAHHSNISSMADDLVQTLRIAGLGVVCHLPTFVYTADLAAEIRKASIKEMVMSMDTAARIGAEKVVLHPGFITGMGVFVPETVKQLSFEAIEILFSHARETGVAVLLENMPPAYGSFFEPVHFEEVFRHFPGLKMTLDIGHANMEDVSGNRAVRFIDKFSDKIGHIHVSDNSGASDDHLPVGSGNTDFKTFSEALKETGYSGTVTLEIFTDQTADLVQSRKKIRKLLD